MDTPNNSHETDALCGKCVSLSEMMSTFWNKCSCLTSSILALSPLHLMFDVRFLDLEWKALPNTTEKKFDDPEQIPIPDFFCNSGQMFTGK